MARNYGNNINATHIADDRGDKVICEGAFFDLETNILTRREVEVSKFDWNKRLDPTRLRNAVLAAQSKAVRNAIRHTIPKPLSDQIFDEAKKLFIGAIP